MTATGTRWRLDADALDLLDDRALRDHAAGRDVELLPSVVAELIVLARQGLGEADAR